MSDVIQSLLNKALGTGARGTKFELYMNFSHPALAPHRDDVYILAKSTSFPGKIHLPIDFKYKGRSIPIKGQVKFENTWTCVFYLTEDHWIKRAFEDWIESLDQHDNMQSDLSYAVRAGQTVGTNYAATITLGQLNFNGDKTTALYNLYNAFPKSVSTVEMNYENGGTISEVAVEFAYSHYDSVPQNDNEVSSFGGPSAQDVQESLPSIVAHAIMNETLNNGTNKNLKNIAELLSQSNIYKETVSAGQTPDLSGRSSGTPEFNPNDMVSRLVKPKTPPANSTLNITQDTARYISTMR